MIEEQFKEILEGSTYTWQELGLLDMTAQPLSKEEFDLLGKSHPSEYRLW